MLRALALRIPLPLALPLLISVLMLCSVSAQLVLFYAHAYRAVRNLAEQNLLQVHERIADRMRDYFQIAERVSHVSRETIEMGHWDRHDLASWRGAFYEQVRGFDTISAIVWGDVFGGAVWIMRYPGQQGYSFSIRMPSVDPKAYEYRLLDDGQAADPPTAVFDYDPRSRPWYQAALAAQAPVWGDIYSWVLPTATTPVLGVPFVVPVYGNSGEMLGVFDVEFSLHDLSRFLGTLTIGRTGVAYVMDQHGLLVATSTDVPVVDPASGNRIRASASNQPLIAASAADIGGRFAGRGNMPARVSSIIDVNGEKVMLMAAPFSRAGNLRWLSVTLVPVDDFVGPIKTLRTQGISIAIIMVVASLWLGVMVALFVARPIVKLSNHVRHIGQGNLDDEITLTGSPEFVRLSSAINAMTDGLRDRLKLRQSLALAMEVQQRLLPAWSPIVPGLEIAGHSEYCDETGGDYFDYLEVGDQPLDTAVIAVGDVSGHGIDAAMIMASARGILRSRARDAGSLSDLLRHMNRQITADVGSGRFMTMVLLEISAHRRVLRWACAGHREPLLWEAGLDEFTELKGAGIPLGVVADTDYQEYQFAGLRAGQILVLATDGLWEAMNPAGEKFGLPRLFELVRDNAHLPAVQIRDRIVAAEQAFRAGKPQSDDITFVIIRVSMGGVA